MITLSSSSQNPDIGCREDEIVFVGTPGSLKGVLTLDNATAEHVLVLDLPVSHTKRSLATPVPVLRVNSGLMPGETRKFRTRLDMDSSTPPGTHLFQVNIGGKERQVRVEIQPIVSVRITPAAVHLVGVKPGLKHSREIRLENTGNVPVTIPNLKHNLAEDLDLICRNMSKATRDKGKEGFDKWIDYLLEGISKDIDWVDISIAEAGKVVPPGETLSVNIHFTLSKNIDPTRSYEGRMRLFDRELRYNIWPA
ncbi:MAG: hypothetical protein IT270_10470 [Saprospiraceae bacterium]|nr:hypothetical protein [Saprospiraceae bacterium]